MPRPSRLPLVAVLAALAALLTPVGAASALRVTTPTRPSVSGVAQTVTTPSSATRQAVARVRDVVVSRGQRSQVRAGQTSLPAPTAAVAGVLLLTVLGLGAGWLSRRDESASSFHDRTVGRSRGRGPPARCCA